MDPFDLFDENILLSKTDKSVHPELDTSLEDTLLAEILELDPLSPRKQHQSQEQTISNPPHKDVVSSLETRPIMTNKENIPPSTTSSGKKKRHKKVKKINPFYSPSKHTMTLVARDLLRKQLQLNQHHIVPLSQPSAHHTTTKDTAPT